MEKRDRTTRSGALRPYRQEILAGVAVAISLICGFIQVIPAVRAFVGLGLSSEVQAVGFGLLLLVFDGAMIAINLQTGSPRRRGVSLVLLCVGTAVYLAALATTAVTVWVPAAVVRAADAAVPANAVGRSDFRPPAPASALDWKGLFASNEDWTARQAVPDRLLFPSPLNRGIAYRLDVTPGDWRRYGAQYRAPVQADVVTAQFYLQAGTPISDSWVGLGACDRADCRGGSSAGSYASIPAGQWTQLTLDLRHQYGESGRPLSAGPVYTQVFYAIKGVAGTVTSTASTVSSVLVGLDDVVWTAGAGVETVREQRGPGEVLYDFESGDVQGWRLDAARLQTTTLELSAEQVYRGRGALKVTTEVTKEWYAMVQAAPRGAPPPRGAWVAHLYVPPDASPEVRVWAKLYTYDAMGLWLAANPKTLQRGWNTLVWDAPPAQWTVGRAIVIGLQIGAEGGAYRGPVYVDDVQLFGE